MCTHAHHLSHKPATRPGVTEPSEASRLAGCWCRGAASAPASAAAAPPRPSPAPPPSRLPPRSGPDGATVYLTSSFIDTTRAVPTPVNYIEALDAATGVVRWANSTPPPPTSGLPNSDTAAAHGVTALPDMAVYAQGQRMYALSAANGSQLWSMVVTTGSSYGAAAANISSITYVEAGAPPAGSPYPLLLLQSTTWEQTRFIAYKLNGSAGAPPTVAWQNRGNQVGRGCMARRGAALGSGRASCAPASALGPCPVLPCIRCPAFTPRPSASMPASAHTFHAPALRRGLAGL